MDAGGGSQEMEISDVQLLTGQAGTLGAEAKAPVASRWEEGFHKGPAWFFVGTDRFRHPSSRYWPAAVHDDGWLDEDGRDLGRHEEDGIRLG